MLTEPLQQPARPGQFVGKSVFGSLVDEALQERDRFSEAVHSGVEDGQLQPRGVALRFGFEGVLIIRQCLVQSSESLEDQTPSMQGSRVARVLPERDVELLEGLIVAALLEKHPTEVASGLDEAVVPPKRFTKHLLGHGYLAQVGETHRKVVSCIQVVGNASMQLLQNGYGAFGMARFLQAQGEPAKNLISPDSSLSGPLENLDSLSRSSCVLQHRSKLRVGDGHVRIFGCQGF